MRFAGSIRSQERNAEAAKAGVREGSGALGRPIRLSLGLAIAVEGRARKRYAARPRRLPQDEDHRGGEQRAHDPVEQARGALRRPAQPSNSSTASPTLMVPGSNVAAFNASS